MPAPERPPTHAELDAGRLMRVAADLEEALQQRGETHLYPELADELSDELGVRDSHLYVAAATMTQIPFRTEAAVHLEICVGNCQKWGAVDLLDRALLVDARRRNAGGPGFAVSAKPCLDRCADAAVVRIHTRDGVAGLTSATVESLDAALADLST